MTINLTPEEEKSYVALLSELPDSVAPAAAAAFFRRSELPMPVLQKVWELSAPKSGAEYNRQALLVALRLIALAQAGIELTPTSLGSMRPPALPRLSGSGSGSSTGTRSAASGSAPAAGPAWDVPLANKHSYDLTFQRGAPVNGKLSGEKARTIFVQSGLPAEILKQIWDLADIDRDAHLDADEFAVAMHLVTTKLQNAAFTIPATLPASLVPPSKRGGVAHSSATPAAGSPAAGASDWPPAADKDRFAVYFKEADKDLDGFVSGVDVKDIFMKSGLPNPILGQVWQLVDTDGTGRINLEEFVLAMYLIAKRVQTGVDLPAVLPPHFVPPSKRRGASGPSSGTSTPAPVPAPIVNNPNIPEEVSASFNNTMKRVVADMPPVPDSDFSAIQMLDNLSKEVESAAAQKETLEKEVREKQSALAAAEAEASSVEAQLANSERQLAALREQKAELSSQIETLESSRADMDAKLEIAKAELAQETAELDKLRSAVDEQKMTSVRQEEELRKLRNEVEQAQREQARLREQLDTETKTVAQLEAKIEEAKSNASSSQHEVDELTTSNSALQKQVSEQEKRQASEPVIPAAELAALSKPLPAEDVFGDDPFGGSSNRSTKSTSSSHKAGAGAGAAAAGSDPFGAADPWGAGGKASTGSAFGDDPFASSSDPFGSSGATKESADPFKNDFFGSTPSKAADPFGGPAGSGAGFDNDPFSSSTAAGKSDNQFGSDPFSSSSHADPFGGSGKSDDPFAAPSKKSSAASADPFAAGDAWGSDPFGGSSTSRKGPNASEDDPFGGPISAHAGDAAASGDIFGDDAFGAKPSMTIGDADTDSAV
ncbi:hypothetical protein CAOG_06353 [Capsaspora owczarzaki ATCC 30864]|uniref:Epidermal growth factor receptor substrate 15 n=1 Tax=Capsaspora owczarzaki (strain ATCC 30864) TaxID=595528 RepID=A0A0D2WTT5_CAPO3|nr:hypothetical protein CAOG_06353 [Capsaspora owczarzaki ATCC 30864]KJE95975.1 hypothetical protein CAOG_006353 [Capsaspora owczarzaki ATCC 30864]|eukprot:XP_004345102.1 hypothetical protein CAOG_06353 [Capsaspora owczarzaki ATCC 30864]